MSSLSSMVTLAVGFEYPEWNKKLKSSVAKRDLSSTVEVTDAI